MISIEVGLWVTNVFARARSTILGG